MRTDFIAELMAIGQGIVALN